MKEFQEANYARVRRRGPRRSSSDIARAKIQGKRHRVSHQCGARCCKPGLFPSLPRRAAPFPWAQSQTQLSNEAQHMCFFINALNRKI